MTLMPASTRARIVSQSVLGAGGVEARQGLVQQKQAGLHGQHSSHGHFLLLSAGEQVGLAVGQVADRQPGQGRLGPLTDLLPGEPQILKAEGDFVEHPRTQDLPLGILQQGADMM